LPLPNSREFIKYETAGGVVLFAVTILALVVSNSPFSHLYESVFYLPIDFHLGSWQFSITLSHWINEGLMTLFFLLVGLEIKREMFVGELNSFAKISLPAIAALGGMVVPALLFVMFNWGNADALRGWAIPTATDIAFALGILSLLGSRIPLSLKMFLTALAIFDDIGAIIIIAIFYSRNLSFLFLLLALTCLLVLFLLNHLKVKRLLPYLILGFALWLMMLYSGVDAVIAGVLLAFAIPFKQDGRQESSLRCLERRLHPWAIFGILPLFAFANAGVSLAKVNSHYLFNSVSLGIVLGLFLGKQLGVFGATWLAVKSKFAHLPAGATWKSIYGIALICGIGFTMSLFIGNLAFGSVNSLYMTSVKLGVLSGSLLSGLVGYFLLRRAH
jgi:NhaA family Na+:H+ antiporter